MVHYLPYFSLNLLIPHYYNVMAINIGLKKKKLLLFLVILGVLCSLFYFEWWFQSGRLGNPLYILIFTVFTFYIITQVYFIWIIYLNARYPKKLKTEKKYNVDVFLPTYNEPLEIIEKTLRAVVNMNYPHKTYLIDDGNNYLHKMLAERYNAIYLTRNDKKDYKAGNINNVLKYSKGEIIAIFDIDHIPQVDYLDKVVGYFDDPTIGAVQVALDHYNSSESFVAESCCTMSDDFFAATMMGMNELNSAVIFGSNSIFRREALISIGGYKPGLAEDLHTSVHLHSKGWKSVYVSEVLAQGLVPADLAAFSKQQLKWANGVFEVLFTIFPKLIRSLKVSQIICYLTRMTYYLAGPVVFFHLILTVLALYSRTFNQVFTDYIIHSIPFLLIFFIIQIYVKSYYFLKGTEKRSHLGGYLLVLGTWPIYTLALLTALIRIKIPFISTPKELSQKNSLLLIIPQLITVCVLSAGIIFKIINFYNPYSFIIIMFAAILILIHFGIFYSALEKYSYRVSNRVLVKNLVRRVFF